ncbi:response regulator transcription factor [Paenibacillus sp. JX-17]|uniref:Response regulator transcription factor n=1 Tax=Paenibacillus lacisoli TaxID=3064525 RepID=A0ABT9CGZ3_9BACL|nr:response regulator transcription factor [Paenibacillus sp. JX-17]MDO7908170.1 response regulator transcription factor [Paenibacillus sp. JX-17]
MYRVFIVDDEPFILEGLCEIIDWSELGFEIVGQAENGRLALEALESRKVDVLMTDISMPVMNGLELIREARKLHQELKVLILSGFNEFDYLKEAMKLGIENYLLKPINVDELESTLRNTAAKLDRQRADEKKPAFDKQILLDNTVYRWLNGTIALPELQERGELLGIRLDQPFVAVAVIRACYGFDSFVLLSAQLQEEPGWIRVRDMNGDTVLIAVMDDEAAGKERLHVVLERLCSAVPARESGLHVGVGSVRRLPEEAPVSYQEARKALEYVIVYPERRVMEHEQLETDRGQVQEAPVDWSRYVKRIMARDADGLADAIQEDLKQYRDCGAIRPEDLQHMALELVIRFKMELESIRHADDEPAMYQAALGRIRESSTFDELLGVLQEVGRRTVQTLLQDMKNPIISQVLNHIKLHFADEMSLKTLGSQYHLHPVYLGQLFHKETGETFAEYINKYRIEKAKEMLRSSNRKVQDIARQVGYWETGYFYKQFKKYVGISPTDYKGLG